MYVLEKSIIPMPKKVENRNERIEIAKMAESKFTLVKEADATLLSEGVSLLLEDILGKICAAPADVGYKITVKIDENDKAFEKIASDEAYYIDITDGGATLCGKSEKVILCSVFNLNAIGDEFKSMFSLCKDTLNK